VFDLDDLRMRAHELATFVQHAAEHHGFDRRRLVAVGFSNGANIAAAVLLLEPSALGGAVLFRAMVPLVPEPLPSLAATPVFMSCGQADPLVPPQESERLAGLFRRAGADVAMVWQPAGHELTAGDVTQARDWLAARSWAQDAPEA
jgi:predicted esterase